MRRPDFFGKVRGTGFQPVQATRRGAIWGNPFSVMKQFLSAGTWSRVFKRADDIKLKLYRELIGDYDTSSKSPIRVTICSMLNGFLTNSSAPALSRS